MKLFWGLIESHQHQHTFDASKWKLVDSYERSSINKFTGYKRDRGHILFYTNTCLSCGDMIEKKCDHTIE